MGKIYGLDDKIKIGDKKIPISVLVNDKGKIFDLIKKGFQLSNDVLEKAHINKIIKNVRTDCVVVDHKKAENVELPKDTKSLNSILKDINTIDSQLNDAYKTEEPSAYKDNTELIDEENILI